MGDRTAVTLTILNSTTSSIIDVIGDDIFTEHDDIQGEGDNALRVVEFEDVNYAQLDFESELRDANIPYSKTWDAGSEYVSGEEHFRLSSGKAPILKTFNGEEHDQVNLTELLKAKNAGNVALTQFLAEQVSKHHVIDWDTQYSLYLDNPLSDEAIEPEVLNEVTGSLSTGKITVALLSKNITSEEEAVRGVFCDGEETDALKRLLSARKSAVDDTFHLMRITPLNESEFYDMHMR